MCGGCRMHTEPIIRVSRSGANLSRYPLHSHVCWEILYYTKSSGVLCVEHEEPISFQEGTVICVPPHVSHGSTSREPFENICVEEPDFPEELCRARTAKRSSGGCIVFQNAGVDLLHLFRLVFRTYVESTSDPTLRIRHLMTCIYDILLAQSESARFIDLQVEKLRNDLLEHFTDPQYRIADALQACAYSECYLRRAFRAQCQMTPVQYLRMLRLKNAAALLQSAQPNQSIAEIAYHSGFADPLYFSKCFHQFYRVAPQTYRATRNDQK